MDEERLFGVVEGIVCDIFRLQPGEFTGATPFDELGIDSRRRVRLLATVETELDVSIGVDVLEQLTDLDSVVRLITAALSANEPTENR